MARWHSSSSMSSYSAAVASLLRRPPRAAPSPRQCFRVQGQSLESRAVFLQPGPLARSVFRATRAPTDLENAGVLARIVRRVRTQLIQSFRGDRDNRVGEGTLTNLGDLTEADALRQAISLELDLAGPGHRDVADVQSSLAVAMMSARKLDEAEELLRAAIDTYRSIGPTANLALALALSNWGELRFLQGRVDEMEAAH